MIGKSDVYFWFLVAATLILFVGALMEEYSPVRWLEKFGIRAYTRPSRRWATFTKRYKLVAFWMVVAGIGGEGLFEYFVNHAEGAVRDFDEGQTIQLRTRADKAERETADEKLITARLEAEVAGRQLSADAIGEIASDLSRFSGRKVFIASYSGDAEAARLGLQIQLALTRAHINVDDNLGRTLAERGGVGFGIDVDGPAADRDLLENIAKSLRLRGKLQTESHVIEPRMRIGDAVTGIMVLLRPLAPNNTTNNTSR